MDIFGFSGDTTIRTPDGFTTIKDLHYGSLIATLYDNQYEFVNEIACKRADMVRLVEINGLPEDLVATPNCHVVALPDPETSNKVEKTPLALLRTSDMVVCPFRENLESPYSNLVPLITYSKLVGAFCAAGSINNGSVVFEIDAVNDSLREEISRITDDYAVDKTYSRSLVINDDNLLRALTCIFGISGTGTLSPNVLKLDRLAKFVLIGGFINACGFEDTKGNIICPLENIKNGMQILELLWSTKTKAAILKPELPTFCSYSLIIEKTPFIEENIGKLKKVHYYREFPEIMFLDKWAMLKTSKIEDKEWNDVVYSVDTVWNASYIAGMVAVNGDYESIKNRML